MDAAERTIRLHELAASATRTCALVAERAEGLRDDTVPVADAEALLARVVALYAARARTGAPPPTAASETITATEAMISTVGLLRAIDLDLFEYILWSGRA